MASKDGGGEQPIYTCKAHVFHIDPKTKRSWLSASNSAICVNFFFDSTRNLYRIISVEGAKAIINSTVTPNMTFTKTSAKFGQWSDMSANTVYGLGFSTEVELSKFIEKFNEVVSCTRQSVKPGSLASDFCGIHFSDDGLLEPPVMQATTPGGGSSTPTNGPRISTGSDLSADVSSMNAQLRNTSLTNGSSNVDSPKHTSMANGMADVMNTSSSSANAAENSVLKYENERLKLALAHSSANAKKWEIELNTLKNNNMRLTSALQESTANVDEWKRQLQAYKEENQRLKTHYIEMEGSKGANVEASDLRKSLAILRLKVESLEMELKSKDDELIRCQQLTAKSAPEDKYKALVQENAQLQSNVSMLQTQLDVLNAAQDTQRRIMEALNTQLHARIQDLNGIHKEIQTALQT